MWGNEGIGVGKCVGGVKGDVGECMGWVWKSVLECGGGEGRCGG